MMSRSNLLDRLNQELEAFGKKAQAALDEGKLQIEQLRVRRRRDHVARDLGLLVHRRERTGEAEPLRMEPLLVRLDELEAELAQLDGQLRRARQQRPAAATGPSPDVSASSAASSAAPDASASSEASAAAPNASAAPSAAPEGSQSRPGSTG
jgi:hypothetical protein